MENEIQKLKEELQKSESIHEQKTSATERSMKAEI
jgi:hypothetical protein